MTLAFPRILRHTFSLVVGLGALLPGIAPTLVLAQQTHADLSVSAVVTPPYFVPGGRNTIELTVHNAGPDALNIHPPYSIVVYGEDHVVTAQPPPYEVVVPAEGCAVERFVTDPLPDGSIDLLFVYYFDVLPAGASRTCAYDIEFYPSTTPPLTLRWQATTWYVLDNTDPNPSNNIFSYTLNAAPLVTPAPVPTGSSTTWFLLGLALISFSRAGKRRRKSV